MENSNSAGLTTEAFTITVTHSYKMKLKDRLKLLFSKGVTIKTYIIVNEKPTVLKDSGEIFIIKNK